jgi:hypothetical protein
MKATRKISLGAVTTIAALVLSGCADDVTAYCVKAAPDANGQHQVIDERYCDSGHSTFFWYYGGQYNSGHVSGGTTVKPADANITSKQGRSISRGGFGGHGGTGGG